MSIDELVQEHIKCMQAITQDKTAVAVGDPSRRADELFVALRHVLCCAILVEATEAQLHDMSQRYQKT